MADTDRSSHIAPEAILVHREKQPSASVAILPSSHRGAHGQCLGRDAQLGQGSHRVARQVDAHPPRNRWAPLDDGAAQPMPAHSPGDGSPGDPAADDEDRTGHRPSPSRPAPKRLVAAMGPVLRRSGYTCTPNRAHTRPDRVKGLVTETWNWRRSSVARRSAQSNRIADILHARAAGLLGRLRLPADAERMPHHSTRRRRWCSTAYAAASARDRTPSLSKMLLTCR